MFQDILIGVIFVGLIAAGFYLVTHHKPPTTASPKDITTTVTAGLSDAWAEVKKDLPGIISATVAQLTEDKAVLAAALQAAQDKIAADKKAHDAALAAVAARVSAAVTASPELPPSPVAPAVAVAQAEDVAAVRQTTSEIAQ